jgi:RNA polymerase sigma-70 factor (ECF subfamily)
VPLSLHPNELNLVERAQQGDADAIAVLYLWYAPAIFRYLATRVNDATAAEDLTSEVFLRAQEALSSFDHRGVPFAAWLFRIAHDRMVDYHRSQARHPSHELSEHLLDGALGPEAQAADNAEFRRLAEAMATLTDEQQTVIQLRLIDGYSLDEAARIMQKTTGAIKALQHRALQRLTKKLAS